MIVDSAIYVDGKRIVSPGTSFEKMYESCRSNGGIAWIGLYQPTPDEFGRVAAEFNLHELAVEDAVQAHQ
ncbi:MAG TPA: hypothetical protein VFQ54_05600, partial [Thermomicrobiales bacterium]|nr:hypothetical protein [Thermomicrobiales bacterium]